jgi:hypothetical protein
MATFTFTAQLTPKSDTAPVVIHIPTSFIEVLISDSRLISKGSQFGHVAISIDGQVYGRAPSSWDVDTFKNYLKRQAYRDTVSFVLRVEPAEKPRLLAEINKRMAKKSEYDIAVDSCSSNASEVLGVIGIIAHDPRFSVIATPSDMAVALKKSPRLIQIEQHPKSQ